MSKKIFGISAQLSQGLTDMINIEANNENIYRNAVIPLARIEPDPNNPRKLSLTIDDIQQLVANKFTLAENQQRDFERLNDLAQSIKISGLINPIVVFKHEEKYRVIAGERRLLATILAQKNEIEARVFNAKPGLFELKLVQWFENTAREDLSILERIDNVRDIVDTYKNKDNVKKMTSKALSEITGMSLSLAGYYWSLLNAPEDVRSALKNGKIANLEKAALISNIEDEVMRLSAINACVQSISLAELRKLISNHKKGKKAFTTNGKNTLVGQVSLGKTKSTAAVKVLIEAVVELPSFSEHKELFTDINWDNKKSVIGAFKKLIKIIETKG